MGQSNGTSSTYKPNRVSICGQRQTVGTLIPSPCQPLEAARPVHRSRQNRYVLTFLKAGRVARMRSESRRTNTMATLLDTVLRLKIWKDNRGQELVEYALLAGFLVTISGAVSPAGAGPVSTVVSIIVGALDVSGGGSGTIQ